MGMIDYVHVRGASRARVLAGLPVPWISNSKREPYIRAVVISAPPWVDMAELRAIQAYARGLSAMLGVPHEVDHIVPLLHPRVCGLTVPWNLEVVTARRNSAKSNAWCPEQQELF